MARASASPLPGSLPHTLGGEEWIEDFFLDFPGNAAAGIGDGDFDAILVHAGADGDFALSAPGFDDVVNGVSGVDEQVQKYLIEITEVAEDRRKFAELRFDVGDVLEFVASDDESAFESAIQIARCFLVGAIHVGEFLHSADDGGNAAESLQHLVHGTRNFLLQVIPVCLFAHRGKFLEKPWRNFAGGRGRIEFLVFVDELKFVVKGILQEAGVVPNKLDGRINFVGDARGQTANGFELLAVAQFHILAFTVGDVLERDHGAENSAVAAHLPGAVLNRKAGAIFAPENLVFDVGVLAVPKTAKNGTVLFWIRGTIGPGVMDRLMGFFAENFVGTFIAQQTESGRIAERAVSFRVDAVHRARGGIEKKIDEFAALGEFRGAFRDALFEVELRG